KVLQSNTFKKFWVLIQPRSAVIPIHKSVATCGLKTDPVRLLKALNSVTILCFGITTSFE
ncbi:MAG: hypothetical protein ACKO7R_18195, partial [Pseudanabaena sp.]